MFSFVSICLVGFVFIHSFNSATALIPQVFLPNSRQQNWTSFHHVSTRTKTNLSASTRENFLRNFLDDLFEKETPEFQPQMTRINPDKHD